MTWYTSDLHFSHKNVIPYCDRPFHNPDVDKAVSHMNEIMVKNWNETVGPTDLIRVIGDFSLGIPAVETYTPRLNGEKELWSGNHDHTHPSHRKSKTPEKAKITRKIYYDAGWTRIFEKGTIEVGGKIINIGHLPYKGDSTDTRYEKYRFEDDGNWLLCGHVHEKWRVKGKMINVGIDAWGGFPIHEKVIIQLMKDYPNGTNLERIVWV